jgi:hypothetical protein
MGTLGRVLGLTLGATEEGFTLGETLDYLSQMLDRGGATSWNMSLCLGPVL